MENKHERVMEVVARYEKGHRELWLLLGELQELRCEEIRAGEEAVRAAQDGRDAGLDPWVRPVHVENWELVSLFLRARLVHVHDLASGRCVKNRSGVRCGLGPEPDEL